MVGFFVICKMFVTLYVCHNYILFVTVYLIPKGSFRNESMFIIQFTFSSTPGPLTGKWLKIHLSGLNIDKYDLVVFCFYS